MGKLMSGVCTVADCGRDVHARDLCNTHYANDRRRSRRAATIDQRLCRNGHELEWFNIEFGHGWCACLTCGARTRPDTPTLENRLWAQAIAEPNTGCWLWTGTVNEDGYGQVKVDYQTRAAYRVAYEIVVGPVPDGLELDHKCRQRACVRPDHLEPVTNLENMIRGHSPMAVALGTGFCQRGHELIDANIVVRSTDGRSQCRQCKRITNRVAVAAYRARKRRPEMDEATKLARFGPRDAA